MKLTSIQEINAFKDAIDRASGNVWAEDTDGRRYDLKDEMEQYIAIGEMLKDPDNNLEIFTSSKSAESALLDFFSRYQHSAA